MALYNRAETFVSCLATLNQLPKYMETECTTFYVEKRLWTFPWTEGFSGPGVRILGWVLDLAQMNARRGAVTPDSFCCAQQIGIHRTVCGSTT